MQLYKYKDIIFFNYLTFIQKVFIFLRDYHYILFLIAIALSLFNKPNS